MTTSSSGSSCFTQRRQVTRVPTRCRCGNKLMIYCSQTEDNPFRRFYRCEIALQRKKEEHHFKWIDEALLEETRMVDAKLNRLIDEVEVLRKEMIENFNLHEKLVHDMEEKINKKMNEEIKKKTKDEMMMVAREIARLMAKKSMERVGIAILVVGGLGWIYRKIMMS